MRRKIYLIMWSKCKKIQRSGEIVSLVLSINQVLVVSIAPYIDAPYIDDLAYVEKKIKNSEGQG